MTNINDQVRAWQDRADTGTAEDARKVAQEVLEQFRHHLRHPGEVQGDPDVAARQVAALTETLAAHQQAGRKRINVEVLADILKEEA